jgi:hypothetical protein
MNVEKGDKRRNPDFRFSNQKKINGNEYIARILQPQRDFFGMHIKTDDLETLSKIIAKFADKKLLEMLGATN